MIKSGLMDNNNENEISAPETMGEHLIPYLMKHILDNKIGIIPYKVQENIRHYNIRDRIEEID
jgi:hypothetical protein